MKKLLCLLLLLALTALCACGAPAAPAPAQTEPPAEAIPAKTAEEAPAAEEPAAAPSSLRLVCQGVELGILDEAEPVLAALGEPLARYETESCAYEGMDELYDYDGVELSVNEIEGVRRITGIILLDDTVATPEGVRIGMPLQEALELMPTERELSGRICRFTDGNTCLSLRTNDADELIAIEYFPAEG